MDPLQAGPAVEIAVEAHDRTDFMSLHHGDVDGIARRHQRAVLRDFTSPKDVRFLDAEHIVDHVQDHLECRPYGFPASDCRIPMKDFLQNFRIGNQALSGGYQAFQNHLRLGLVRMRRSDEIHRNVGIDKDQA